MTKQKKSSQSIWEKGLYLFYGLFIILIPWQTRWIFHDFEIKGESWSMMSLGVYGSMLLLFLVAFFFAKSREIKPYFSKNIFWYLFFFYFFVASLVSFDPVVSFYYLLLINLAILFVYIVRHMPTHFSLQIFFISGFIQALIALCQFVRQEIGAHKWLGLAQHLPQTLGDSVVEFADQRVLRAYGALPHPNILGGFLALAIIAGIYLWLNFYKERYKEKWQNKVTVRDIVYFLFILAGLIIMTFALLATFSRGAVLALLVSIFGLAIILFINKDYLSWQIFSKYFLFFVFIFLIFNWWIPGAWSSRIKADNRLELKSNQQRAESMTTFYWSDAKDIIFGQGLGTNPLVNYDYNSYKNINDIQPIHNIFLLSLAELGILGWIFLGLAISKVFYKIKRIDFLPFSLLIVVLVISLFDHYLLTTWTGLLMLLWPLGYIKNS